jgi:hypothetical protein
VPAVPPTRRDAHVRKLLLVLREDWPRLVIEVLVLVLGITASFALDQWRREREDRQLERRALEGVKENLVADTVALRGARLRLARMSRGYSELLQGTAPADSIDTYMDLSISYVAFVRTDNAYQELRQTGGSRLLRNHAVLTALIDLYAREYSRAGEWDAINRGVVLDRMIPYVDEHAPYNPERAGGEVVLGLAPAYRALIRDDRFRNLLATNRDFKVAQQSVYAAAARRATEVLQLLDRELARTAGVSSAPVLVSPRARLALLIAIVLAAALGARFVRRPRATPPRPPDA